MFLSVFDLFKIGIGPSSSHTMGPMTAACRFLDLIAARRRATAAPGIARLSVSFHGSLAYTGEGHASDRAVLIGLCGERPETVDADRMASLVAEVRAACEVRPAGHPPYRLDPTCDVVFDRATVLPGHPNGMVFRALDGDGRVILERAYFSIGGGFVAEADELAAAGPRLARTETEALPYPFRTAAEMLRMAADSGLGIADMMRANERAVRDDAELDARLDLIAATMSGCVDRGLAVDGTLPGRLGVKRRAKALNARLIEEAGRNRPNPLLANDWLAVWAMAVNEENAAGGRVVTAPTNGAAGVIPAVLRFYRSFYPEADAGAERVFLLTAAAIGGIIKQNASISGAEVGCQGEVGSASAMAAAGLAAVLGGTPAQIENAAEIALEHHLGMTCDPIAGLVQVPCIERNAFGAVKAVTAASIALKADGIHFVSLDACVATMRDTGIDMNEKYKETSLGGLAVNLPDC
jgi:L-serine dehydratase